MFQNLRSDKSSKPYHLDRSKVAVQEGSDHQSISPLAQPFTSLRLFVARSASTTTTALSAHVDSPETNLLTSSSIAGMRQRCSRSSIEDMISFLELWISFQKLQPQSRLL
ncbi:unnamed protein product [Cuscuta europaea]|uniref:Uncharacterized protein n=1 Tax=Cuscuta europaea TaxID=41803 RepID=A0A9P0YVT8_CUSEU|nr:unnamed protein product [Cuscuta europaea]